MIYVPIRKKNCRTDFRYYDNKILAIFKNFTFGLSLATAAAELSRLIGLFYTVFQKNM